MEKPKDPNEKEPKETKKGLPKEKEPKKKEPKEPNPLLVSIREKKPDWRNSTISTYYSSIKKIVNEMSGNRQDLTSMDYLIGNSKNVIEQIKKSPEINTRLNRCQSINAFLKVLAGDTPSDAEKVSMTDYKEYLVSLNKDYKVYLKSTKKSIKKKPTWLTYDKFVEIVNALTAEINRRCIMAKNPVDVDSKEKDLIQQLILLRLISIIPLSLVQLMDINKEDFEDLDGVYVLSLRFKPSKGEPLQSPKTPKGSKEDKKEFMPERLVKPKPPLIPLDPKVEKPEAKGRKIIFTNEFKKLILFFNKTNDSKALFINPKTGTKIVKSINITKEINKAFFRHAGGKKVSIIMLRQLVINNVIGSDISLFKRYRINKIITGKLVVPHA